MPQNAFLDGTISAVNRFPNTMKKTHLAHPVALAVLIAATATPFNYAFAQEATPVVAAPPVAPAPTPTPPEAAAPAATPAPVFAPRQEVAQPTPVRPVVVAPEAAAPEQPAAATPAPTRRIVKAAPRARATVPAAPRAADRVATRAVAPAVAASPQPLTVDRLSTPANEVPESTPTATNPGPPIPPTVEAPLDPPIVAPIAAEPTRNESWIWIGAAIAAIALLFAGILARRRRSSPGLAYNYPPEAAADPVSAAIDLDQRPWIRLSLQPMGSETRGDVTIVDYQLIVENEGHVPARDVRVSSFVSGLKEDTLGNSNAQTHHIDVAAGASVPIAASVTIRNGVEPKIVADARYKLPNGKEGHLAARFAVDISTPEAAAQVEDVLERV